MEKKLDCLEISPHEVNRHFCIHPSYLPINILLFFPRPKGDRFPHLRISSPNSSKLKNKNKLERDKEKETRAESKKKNQNHLGFTQHADFLRAVSRSGHADMDNVCGAGGAGAVSGKLSGDSLFPSCFCLFLFCLLIFSFPIFGFFCFLREVPVHFLSSAGRRRKRRS